MRTILLLYVIGISTYGIYSKEIDLLIPYVTAVCIFLLARMVLYCFSIFAPTDYFKQILYLFLISIGMQYIPLLMRMEGERISNSLQTIIFIPALIAIALFAKYIFSLKAATPIINSYDMTEAPITEKTVKNDKPIMYYEIFEYKKPLSIADSLLTKRQPATCV